MDRAAFLRSQNFLRPLPPTIWQDALIHGNTTAEEEAYSGSTITPPSTSKTTNSSSIVLLEESLFVVSIEPRLVLDGRPTVGLDTRDNGGGNGADTMGSGRKRGRDDDDDQSATFDGISFGPAFFQQRENASSATPNESNCANKGPGALRTGMAGEVQDATATMDADNESLQQEDDADDDARGTDRDHAINADPSLCTFEAVILKKLPSALLPLFGENNDNIEPAKDKDVLFATPTGRHEAANDHG